MKNRKIAYFHKPFREKATFTDYPTVLQISYLVQCPLFLLPSKIAILGQKFTLFSRVSESDSHPKELQKYKWNKINMLRTS